MSSEFVTSLYLSMFSSFLKVAVYFIPLFIFLFLVKLLEKKLLKGKNKQKKDLESYAGKYKSQPILTAKELNCYNVMSPIVKKLGYIIFAKVRLADIITPDDSREYNGLFAKIKSKHCDFVILDQRMNIKAVIEIDDTTHNREDRKVRYNFTDYILGDCGIKILHYDNINPLQFERDIK